VNIIRILDKFISEKLFFNICDLNALRPFFFNLKNDSTEWLCCCLYAAYEKLMLVLHVNKKKFLFRRQLNLLTKRQSLINKDIQEEDEEEEQLEKYEDDMDLNEDSGQLLNQNLPFFSIIKMIRFSNLK
jgi:hypothetical protein